MEFLFIAIGFLFGFVIAYLFLKSKPTENTATAVLEFKIIELEKEKVILQTNIANSEKDYNRLANEFKIAKNYSNS